MRNTLYAGVLLAATLPQPGPTPCWQNGVAVACTAPPVAGNLPAQPTVYPERRQYPPEWYYNPYTGPQFHCKIECGQ
jgi:hypothetical protein